jgi:hypothetical protein
MRLAALLLAAAPLWGQTRVVAPVEAPAAVPAAAVGAAGAPRLSAPTLSAPGVLPNLSLPVSPAAVQPRPAAASPASLASVVAAPAPTAVLAVPAAAAALPAAAAAGPQARLAPQTDPFSEAAEGAPSPLAAFFAAGQETGAQSPGVGTEEAAAAGGRLFDGAAVRPTPDLAPTGVIPRLEYRDLGALDVAWIDVDEHRTEYQNLRFVLTSDPSRQKALTEFFRREPDGMNSVLRPMFLALRSVTESPKLAGDARMRAVAGLLFRYYNALRPLIDDPTMPEPVRARASDVILNFLSEWRVATELLRGGEVRRALDRLEDLEARARALEVRGPAPVPAAPRAAAPSADIERGWEVLPAPGERVTADEVRQSLVSLDGLKARVDKIAFFLERLLTRHRLAGEKDMRPAFVEARRLEVLEYLRETVTPVRRLVRGALPRYTEMTLGRTWLGDDQRRRPPYVWVPDHPGLTMRAVTGGFAVRAVFETHIDDARTLAEFKRSIEQHWTGSFDVEGRELSFTVAVTVRTIPRGAPYSPDALRLKESDYPYALPDTIALSRSWQFDAAAHEFGHILGLPDEYIEFYAPAGRTGVTRYNPGSLMSGHTTGVVHGRHRRFAYNLLAVNSLVR